MPLIAVGREERFALLLFLLLASELLPCKRVGYFCSSSPSFLLSYQCSPSEFTGVPRYRAVAWGGGRPAQNSPLSVASFFNEERVIRLFT